MMQIVISSTALLLAAIYFILYLRSSERSFPVYVLLAALLGTSALELFDLLSVTYPNEEIYWKKFALVVEGFLPAAWLLFSLTHARQRELKLIPLLQRVFFVCSLAFPVAALAWPVETFFYSPDFAAERILFLNNTGFVFYAGLLLFMIISLINLEATIANASLTSRWKIKFEVVGAGCYLAVLIFYYSQGLLYRTINMNLLPVRALMLVVALGMMIYSRLARGNGVRIAVSKNMAYKSVVLFAVGLYLVTLGLMGEGLKYFGESFQRSMAVALAFVSGLLLLIVLLSETVKRRIKVFLHKNFYQSKYDYRAQWLQFTDRLSLSQTGDELLKAILSGFCETFGMRCGGLYLYNHERNGYHEAAVLEMEPAEVVICRDEPVLLLMAERAWVVNIREEIPAAGDEFGDLLKRNAMCFLVPLFLNNAMDGFIMLGKPINTDETYNYEDYDIMKTLARQASSALLNLRLSEQLARAKEMEAIGRVSAFVVHDLKNLVYTVSLVLDNARNYMDDPEFQNDMLESLSNTVARMKILISRLKNLPEQNELRKEPADLLKLVTDTASLITGGEVRVTGSAVIAEVDHDELQKVALNLLMNAMEATDGDGPVTVEVGDGEQAFIRVTDEGHGIPEDFLRRHLFTPFRTTKKKGLGIGLYQCKQIVEAHGGRIEATSEPGRGSIFTVWLPFANRE